MDCYNYFILFFLFRNLVPPFKSFNYWFTFCFLRVCGGYGRDPAVGYQALNILLHRTLQSGVGLVRHGLCKHWVRDLGVGGVGWRGELYPPHKRLHLAQGQHTRTKWEGCLLGFVGEKGLGFNSIGFGWRWNW